MIFRVGNVEVIARESHALRTIKRRFVEWTIRCAVIACADGLDERAVSVDCYLIAQLDTNLLELGMATQATVAAVVQELAGMTVHEVNVYIQDVEATSG